MQPGPIPAQIWGRITQTMATAGNMGTPKTGEASFRKS